MTSSGNTLSQRNNKIMSASTPYASSGYWILPVDLTSVKALNAGPVAQLDEHLTGDHEVAGSNTAWSATFFHGD